MSITIKRSWYNSFEQLLHRLLDEAVIVIWLILIFSDSNLRDIYNGFITC